MNPKAAPIATTKPLRSTWAARCGGISPGCWKHRSISFWKRAIKNSAAWEISANRKRIPDVHRFVMGLGSFRHWIVIPTVTRRLSTDARVTRVTLFDQSPCATSLAGRRMTTRRIFQAAFIVYALLRASPAAAETGSAAGFDYNRDTLSFANWTVFSYENGHVVSHKNQFGHHYSRRCFVMTRTVEQFYKFARFEPKALRVDDRELSKRIRNVTRRPPWHDPLPAEKRVVIPGYRNLRELSRDKTSLMQQNIGLGWVVYLRPGNVRMFYLHNKNYQVKTHEQLERALAGREFFGAYLSDFPILHINHSVLV